MAKRLWLMKEAPEQVFSREDFHGRFICGGIPLLRFLISSLVREIARAQSNLHIPLELPGFNAA